MKTPALVRRIRPGLWETKAFGTTIFTTSAQDAWDWINRHVHEWGCKCR